MLEHSSKSLPFLSIVKGLSEGSARSSILLYPELIKSWLQSVQFYNEALAGVRRVGILSLLCVWCHHQKNIVQFLSKLTGKGLVLPVELQSLRKENCVWWINPIWLCLKWRKVWIINTNILRDQTHIALII